jgi:hypothetical protein
MGNLMGAAARMCAWLSAGLCHVTGTATGAGRNKRAGEAVGGADRGRPQQADSGRRWATQGRQAQSLYAAL